MFYPDPNNIMKFTLTVVPDDGIWKGVGHKFDFDVGDEYPINAPNVSLIHCAQKFFGSQRIAVATKNLSRPAKLKVFYICV
jgi:hypothetical protein